MKYKINFISGFKFSFDEITNVLCAIHEVEKASKNASIISNFTAYNERKVKILISYLIELEMIFKRNYQMTKLGQIVYENDRYIEDRGTIWILHYILSTKESLVIWNRLFNKILSTEYKNREMMMKYFLDLKEELSEYTFNRNIRKEIKMIMDTYIYERFGTIGLINNEEDKYSCNTNSSMPDLILLASIVYFRDKYYAGASALNIKDICNSENSPGRLFFLDESYLRTKLETMKRNGLIGIESRADLDQVRLGSDMTFEGVLEQYYKSL